MIRKERRITVSEVAAHLDISYGSAYAIFHDGLGYRKVCARWVLKELTVVHKRQCVEVVTQFVRRYEEDPCILERIVTSDKTWMHTMILRAKDKAWNGGIPPLQCRRNSKDSLPLRKSC